MKAIIYINAETAERLAKDSTQQLYTWDLCVIAQGEGVQFSEPEKPIPGIKLAELPFTLPHLDVLQETALAELDRQIQRKTAEMHKTLMELQARKQDLLAIAAPVTTVVVEGEGA